MRQRISAGLGLIIALVLALIPVFGVPVASASQNGTQGDDSYESPQFGYTVSWGDDWSVRGRDVISNRGGYDTLTLRGADGTLLIQGQGSDITASDAVEKRIRIEGSDDDVVTNALDSAVPSAGMIIGINKILIAGYTLPEDQNVVIVVLAARERDFDAAVASVQEQVLFNDEPILTGEAGFAGDETDESPIAVEEATEEPTEDVTETATEEATEESMVTPAEETDASTDLTDEDATAPVASDGTYTGPLYGYSFVFDPDLWEVTQDIESDESDGLQLVSDSGALTIWSWNAYGADPVACLDGESGYYGTEDATVADWVPAEDANGDPLRYEADDYAYGVFRLTYTDPETNETSNLVDYIECRSIPGVDATVIIYASSTPELYNDHLDTVLDVAETIAFENEDAPEVDQPATAPAGNEIPETALSGSLYTSPSFGFTIDIPAQWQVEDEQIACNDDRLMLTNGTSDVMIRATDAYGDDLAGCVDFAAENAPYDLELAETAEGRPFGGDDRNGAYGNFLYDNGDEAYSISCQYIEGGESVLIVTQDVAEDLLASQRKFRIDLQQAIDLP